MISTTRQWFRRNRTTFAIGAGVLAAGYGVAQYALGKLSETRQRMSDERIAKEKYGVGLVRVDGILTEDL
jgi:peroxin-3